MLKRLFMMALILSISMLYAVTVDTNKDTYGDDEEIVVNFTELKGEANEWVAIYPSDSTNDFGNIIGWKLTGAISEGSVTFGVQDLGTYDIRLFEGAEFLVSTQITVTNDLITTVETTQDVYAPNDEITALYEDMSGSNKDWIGIYPAGSTNDWGNVVQWAWIQGDVAGMTNFEPLPAGDYEVRVFFNDSFNLEASYGFKVEAPFLNIETRKDVYDPYELIHIDFTNMQGVNTDWIGIFAIGAGHLKENALEWRDTKSLVNGELSFNGLPSANYEVRAYFDNIHQKTINLNVQNQAIARVLYDDFEDGVIDPRWVRVAGNDMTLLNVGVNAQGVASTERKVSIAGQRSLRTYRDYRGGVNHSGYYFNFENPDSKLKFLEIDMKIGESSHVFAFGVKVRTKLGDRRIEFASWLNHTMPSGQQIIRGPYGNVLAGHREAFTQDNYLHVHPGPSDYYVGTSGIGGGSNMFIHYKINIEEKLRVLEPDNELLGITLFTTSGGDYDNLALTSQ